MLQGFFVCLVGLEFGGFCLFVLTDEEEVLPVGLGVKRSEGRMVGQECFLYREAGQK